MPFRFPQKPVSGAPMPLRLVGATILIALSLRLSGASASPRVPEAASKDSQQICANVAASVEAARLDRQRKELGDLQQQVGAKLAALEAKQSELRAALERIEAFERKGDDSLVELYSRMKPEAAAAQLAQLDDEIAASLMLKLKAKTVSGILNEMEAARGAALAKRIAQLHAPREGKRP